MDFIEGLPLSDGYDTILVIVCHLSKMVLFIATHRDIDAEDLAMLFLVHIFSKHGTLLTSSLTVGNTLSPISGGPCVDCLASRPTSPQLIILKWTGKQNG